MSKDNFSFIDEAIAKIHSPELLDTITVEEVFILYPELKKARTALVEGFKAAMLEVIKQNTEHEYVEGYELGIDFCVASKLHKALETLVNSKGDV